ncbi:MAG: ferrochelatase [Pseudomonadota bacterium]
MTSQLQQTYPSKSMRRLPKKNAVILFNLGGPDSKQAIRPFLIRFFMDPNIIAAPYLVRFFISRLIAWRRSKKEAGTSYGVLGNKSPLLENTQKQAEALQAVLGDTYKVFICMRYWHPLTAQIVEEVKAYNPDHIVLLPLYPQYSTSTTLSSIQEWQKECHKQGLSVPTALTCCYPFDEGFIAASADNIRKAYSGLQQECGRAPRLLFSAHGLPEKIIEKGDPYQWQCEEGARKIAAATQIPNLDWSICYQSRVGSLKWIGPSTEEALHKAAADKMPVLIYPHAFVSEHVETLVEIEVEYRELAHEIGVPAFARVSTVSTHPDFIEGLRKMVEANKDVMGYPHPAHPRLCPGEFGKCCHNCITIV